GVAQQIGARVAVDAEEIEPAVVIEVADCEAARGARAREGAAGAGGGVLERPAAAVPEEAHRLLVADARHVLGDERVDAPVGSAQVEPPVPVEVENLDSPTAVGPGRSQEPGALRSVGEGAARLVPEEGVAFAVEVRHEEAQPTDVLVIADADAHSRTDEP